MDEATKKSLPQQGSSKSREKKGLEKDPDTPDTEMKKHWDKRSQNNHKNN